MHSLGSLYNCCNLMLTRADTELVSGHEEAVMNLITQYNAVNNGWCPYNIGRRCLGGRCMGWSWAVPEEAAENLFVCKEAAGVACSEDCSQCAYRLGRCALLAAGQQSGEIPVYRGNFIMAAE